MINRLDVQEIQDTLTFGHFAHDIIILRLICNRRQIATTAILVTQIPRLSPLEGVIRVANDLETCVVELFVAVGATKVSWGCEGHW